MLKRNTSFLPIVGLVGAMLLWGTSFIAMKLALYIYDPLVVVFGRMAIASLVFLLCGKRLKRFTYKKGDWKLLLLLAICEPCLYFIFESYALLHTTASQAGIVSATLPLIVAFAASFFLKERLRATTIAGFAIAIIGIVMITSQSVVTQNAPNPFLGNSLEFIAMCAAAGYTIAARFLGPRYSAFALTAFQMFCGTFFFMPVLFWPSTHLPFEWGGVPSLAVVYLGACVTVGAYSLYNYGLRKIPASRASAYVNLIPVFAVFFGWLILHEQFTSFQGWGMVVVLAGVWLSSYTPDWQKLEARSA